MVSTSRSSPDLLQAVFLRVSPLWTHSALVYGWGSWPKERVVRTGSATGPESQPVLHCDRSQISSESCRDGEGGDKGRRIVPRHKFNLRLHCGESKRNPSSLTISIASSDSAHTQVGPCLSPNLLSPKLCTHSVDVVGYLLCVRLPFLKPRLFPSLLVFFLGGGRLVKVTICDDYQIHLKYRIGNREHVWFLTSGNFIPPSPDF